MIKENAKKILSYMLEQVISLGDLNANFYIRYDTLFKELNLESENLCRVCVQYLNSLHYISIIENDNGNRLVRLQATGIDFLESN